MAGKKKKPTQQPPAAVLSAAQLNAAVQAAKAVEPDGKSAPQPKREKPSPRSTAEDVETRIEIVKRMVARCLPVSQIKRYCFEKWQVGYRGAMEYIARAKASLREDVNEDTEVLVGMALENYREVIRNPESDGRDIMDAQDRICRMLGLDRPIKVAQTDTDGNDVAQLDFSRLSLPELAALAQMRQKLLGAPPPIAATNGHAGRGGGGSSGGGSGSGRSDQQQVIIEGECSPVPPDQIPSGSPDSPDSPTPPAASPADG